jgi:plastocyanin
MRRLAGLLGVMVVGALLGATSGSARPGDNPKLSGSVGPDYTITLKNADGVRVTHLDPGTYDIQVQDNSGFHNFHLTGPGVDKATGVEETGTQTWTVTLQDGTYVYVCDEHSSSMRGTFTVGAITPPPPSEGTGAITATTKLVLTDGPGFTISLKTAAGKSFKAMRRGTYTVLVRDKSAIHNAHVTAPGGVSKKTGVAFVGRATWKLRLTKTGTLRYRCDPHTATLHGSKKIV